MKTPILAANSLVLTVDRFNKTYFNDENWIPEAESIVEWTSGQLGKTKGYAGSFAMTDGDWQIPFRLFSGEPVTTCAGRSHVIAQEATRMLRIISSETGWDIPACNESENRLSERIFNNPKSIASKTGEYCCGTCSTAFWRALHSGAYSDRNDVIPMTFKTLDAHANPEGGWRRFPFYYTLYMLLESHHPEALHALSTQSAACEQRFKGIRHRTDSIACRRQTILKRVLSSVER